MSYLKYGLYHLGSQCIRRNNLRSTRILARIPLFILLTSQAFSAQAEFYFNPRFLSDDPTAVADLSGLKMDKRYRREPTVWIYISMTVI